MSVSRFTPTFWIGLAIYCAVLLSWQVYLGKPPKLTYLVLQLALGVFIMQAVARFVDKKA